MKPPNAPCDWIVPGLMKPLVSALDAPDRCNVPVLALIDSAVLTAMMCLDSALSTATQLTSCATVPFNIVFFGTAFRMYGCHFLFLSYGC